MLLLVNFVLHIMTEVMYDSYTTPGQMILSVCYIPYCDGGFIIGRIISIVLPNMTVYALIFLI